MEQRLKEIAQTQEEIRQAIRIIVNILWKMGNYLYKHLKDENLKAHLRELGEELKRIKEPRKR